MLDAPEITDAEYDTMMRELQALEEAHPELVTPIRLRNASGESLGKALSRSRIRAPMLSLDNALDEAELRDFDRRVQVLLGGEEFDMSRS